MPQSSQRTIHLTTQPLAPDDVAVWNWPLRDEGLQSWGLAVAGAAVVALVWTIFQSWQFTLLTAATLTIAAWRLWVPVKWELGLTGVSLVALGFRRRIPWMAVARFEIAENGVWLFADRETTPQRSTFIAYGGQRACVTACIEYYLGTWTAATESTRSYL